MRWLPFIAIFLYVYIEISIFIQVAHVLGVLLTLVLVIFTSVIGMSLVRNQGFKNFVLMQQTGNDQRNTFNHLRRWVFTRRHFL
ncbi:FxsA family protein, partial [Escherichia sp. SS-MK2]